MTTVTGTQSDLFAWARELGWENTRVAEINAEGALGISGLG
jgi:hypothetical protein